MPLKLCDRCWRLFITDRSFHPRLTLPRPLCTITTQTGTAETQTWRRRQRDSGGGGGGRTGGSCRGTAGAGTPRPRTPRMPPAWAPARGPRRPPRRSRRSTAPRPPGAAPEVRVPPPWELRTPPAPDRDGCFGSRTAQGPGSGPHGATARPPAPPPGPAPPAEAASGCRRTREHPREHLPPPPSPGGKMAPGAGRRAGAAAPGGTAGPGAPPTAPALPFAARPADSGCGGGRISFQPARPRAESWRPPRRAWRWSFFPHAQAPPHKPTRPHAKSGWQETPQGRD